MKSTKKLKYILFAALICIIGTLVWYNMPLKMLDIDADNVAQICIFDGTQGKKVEVTDTTEIHYIIENLNSITARRDGISFGYMGYRFRIEVYTYNGNSMNCVAKFIINSENSIRKDPFFYRVENSEIDFNYIQSLFS